MASNIQKSKELRAYKKRRKETRKKLKRMAKIYKPYDWGYLQDFVEVIINDMYDYYNEGVNVWQVDESRLTIVNQLLKALDLIDATKEDHYGFDCSKQYTPEEYQEMENKIHKAYEDLYTFVGKHLQEWWD